MNAVLLQGMPFDSSGEIAFISTRATGDLNPNIGGTSYPDFIDFRRP